MIYCVGEVLIDSFNKENTVLNKCGGAPFNVACNLNKWGEEAFFYGAIGKDSYGKIIENFIDENKYKNFILEKYNNHDTSLALVTIINGERYFKFKRENGSDYRLNISKFRDILSKSNNSDIVHLGSLILSYEEGRNFIKGIIENKKTILSFDVNYRDDIFENEDAAREIFLSIIPHIDILKVTEEELEILTKEKDLTKALELISHQDQLICVSCGKEGSLFYINKKIIKASSIAVKPVDSTGAGDAFYSYVLYSLNKKHYLNLSDDELKDILKNANVVGAVTTLNIGAIEAVPYLDEIKKYL